MVKRSRWDRGFAWNGSIALWFPDRNINGKQHRITFVIFLKATAFNLKLSRHKKLLLFSQLFLSFSLTPPTHIQSPNPLTCVTRCTTWAAVPYMQLSAQCECLKLPEAQIISLTSLKTHETLHRQQALSSSLSYSARLRAQTLLIHHAPRWTAVTAFHSSSPTAVPTFSASSD